MTFVAAALVAATLLVGCVASEAGRSPKRTPSSAPTATPASSAPSTVSPLPRVAAGLPPGLGGRAWTAITASGRWIGGRFGRPGRLELPEGDLPLATADDVIATSQATADDASTIRVRDLGTGRLVAEVRRPEHIVSGVILGDRLVASGYDPANESSDPGLIAIGVADGSVAMLMSPAGLPNGWTGAAHRSVIASPTGRTLVSAVCLMDRCSIDVVDPTTGTWRNVVPDIAAFPRVTTDDVLIVGPDGYVDEIDAFDISTGQRLWTKRDAEFQVGYLTS
ncbi:MAG TPA: hypothetical protein VIV06_01450, partial [Candidatus Limnocylindrales bacterium]